MSNITKNSTMAFLKIVAGTSISTSIALANSIYNPIILENGKTYKTSSEKRDYFTFTLSKADKVVFNSKNSTKNNGKFSYSTNYTLYDTDYNLVKSKNCGSKFYTTNHFKTCEFGEGTFVVQVSNIYTKSVNIYSKSMSDYKSPECKADENKYLINSLLIYTQEELDEKIQQAVDSCKDNPSSCGIDISSDIVVLPELPSNQITPTSDVKNQQLLTRSYIEALPTGWSLLGQSDSMQDFSVFNSANIVYFFQDGAWKNYNPNSTTPPTVVPKNFQGFWLNK